VERDEWHAVSDFYFNHVEQTRSPQEQIEQLNAQLDKLSEGRRSDAGLVGEAFDCLCQRADARRVFGARRPRGGEHAAFSSALPAGEPHNRLALAKWTVSPDNPLTARVTVNRMWNELFGAGLVETTEDFGIMGQRPSHPELLDWLAVEFRESGWDIKHMYKLMVMSAAYRQSAKSTPEQLPKIRRICCWRMGRASAWMRRCCAILRCNRAAAGEQNRRPQREALSAGECLGAGTSYPNASDTLHYSRITATRSTGAACTPIGSAWP
jgi:hypothetical protein